MSIEKPEEKIQSNTESSASPAREHVVTSRPEQDLFKTAEQARTNASDGSLQQYQGTSHKLPADWAQQNESIELFEGDVAVSRTKPGNESLFHKQQDVLAQGFSFPNPVDVYKREVEHKYRGKELETMKHYIPENAWDEAYKAFPELQQLGENDAKRLMKAIIANELEHYGKFDLTEDAIANAGLGNQINGRTIGFAQVSAAGVRDMAHKFDLQVKLNQREDNPLKRFEKMDDGKLAKAIAYPENAPLFVAAHNALDLGVLNRHKNELHVSLLALGYIYNADQGYVSFGAERKLMAKKEAENKKLSKKTALPTESVLAVSEHAANIKKWLEKLN